MTTAEEVEIDYTNYRGVRSVRTIRPWRIHFGANEWHPQTQWLLEAMDTEKGELRTFAMGSIHSWKARIA